MRALSGICAAIAVASLTAGVAPAQAPPAQALLDQAVTAAVDRICGAINEKASLKDVRVAVVPLVGDKDGRVTRTLTTKLIRTHLKVHADKATVEGIIIPDVAGKMRIADLMDEETRSRLKLAHVQGLMYGWVEEASVQSGRARARVNVNIVQVSDGALLWGEIATDTSGAVGSDAKPPPGRSANAVRFVVVAVGAAVVLLLLSRMMRGKRVAGEGQSVEDRLDRDRVLCNRSGRDLAAAKSILKESQDAAYAANKAELVQAIKESVEGLTRLADDVKLSPAGSSSMFKAGAVQADHLDQLVAHDTVLEKLLEQITDLAQKSRASSAEDEVA